MVNGREQAPRPRGGFERDPLSVTYDSWARGFLAQLRGDLWEWHGRRVDSGPGPLDSGGLSHEERAAVRSLYWSNSHTKAGIRIRSDYSLQISWGAASRGPGRRTRMITARLVPYAAARRLVLLGVRPSYITSPSSRGALPGEGWEPKG